MTKGIERLKHDKKYCIPYWRCICQRMLTNGVYVLGVLGGRLPGVFMQEGHKGGLLQQARAQLHLQVHVQRLLDGKPEAASALVT